MGKKNNHHHHHDATSKKTSRLKESKKDGDVSSEAEEDKEESPFLKFVLSHRIFRYSLALLALIVSVVLITKKLGGYHKGGKQNAYEMDLETISELTWLAGQASELRSMLNEQQHAIESKFNESSSTYSDSVKRPGLRLAEEGAVQKYPVVMIPGFVTSGLEVWSGLDCARKYFRQRLWTGTSFAKSFISNSECWRQHMSLDPFTGSDPAKGMIRLRACAGFEAADYFIANYWVWGKLIQNLADVGYTSSTMAMMPYDWRLAYPILEERDGYFSGLQATIERFHKLTGRKVVLASHSMGAQVCHYFFAWVTASAKQGGGGGGKKWVDEHIHSYINIAGVHVGVPKATTALLSGEMSDTNIMEPMGSMIEQFFGRKLRRDLFNTWGSLWTMLPKGGNALYTTGEDFCLTRSADDPFCPLTGPSPLLVVTNQLSPPSDEAVCSSASETQNTCSPSDELVHRFLNQSHITTADAINFLTFFGSGYYSNLSATRLMSFGQQRGIDNDNNDNNSNNNERYIHNNDNQRPSSRAWHDATVTPLPYAPTMRIYCLYGTGVDTERAYHYRFRYEDEQELSKSKNKKKNGGGSSQRVLSDPPLVLDQSIENEAHNVRQGVRFSDGDGSLPILSLGYLCADAWQRLDSGLNPSQALVTTREFVNRREFMVDDPVRSGRWSSEHVEMMGNYGMMEDFVRIATDFHVDSVKENRIESRILDIANRINAYPGGGGLFQKKSFWKL